MPDDDDINEQPRDIFVKLDGPERECVQFYLHDSLSLGQKRRLKAKIEDHGGEICGSERRADTLLVDRQILGAIRNKYAHSKTIYVEEAIFIARCIERNKYYHDMPTKKGMGGPPLGSSRTEYTADDDYHLARYLAARIPNKESGGRTGNNIYKELCDQSQRHRYRWAKNHSWQSWRNRYKSKQPYFDPMIATILKTNPPHPDGKGEYHLDRRAVGLGRRSRTRNHRKVAEYRVEENSEDDSEDADEDDVDSSDAPRQIGRGKRARDDVDGEAQKKRRASNSEDDYASPSEPPNGFRDWDENQPENGGNEFSATDNDQVRSPGPPEAGPSNTQATLVATQVQRHAMTKASSTGPQSSPPPPTPTRAARNRERTETISARVTGKPTAPVDAQAITVTSLPAVVSLTQPPRPRQTQREPASASGRVERTTTYERSPSLGSDVEEILATSSANARQGFTSASGGARRAPSERSPSLGDDVERPVVRNHTDVRRVIQLSSPQEEEQGDADMADVIVVSSTPVLKAQAQKKERAARKTPANSPMRPPSQIVLQSSLAPAPVPDPTRQVSARDRRPTRAAPSQMQSRADDAPYRNTRGRSRSVEPQPLPAVNRKGEAVMQVIEEIDEDEEHAIMAEPPAEVESYNSVDAVEDVLEIMEEEEEEDVDGYSVSSDSDSGEDLIKQVAKKINEEGMNSGFFTTSENPHTTPSIFVDLSRSSGGSASHRPLLSSTITSREGRRTSFLSSQARPRVIERVESENASENDFPTPGTRAERERARLLLAEKIQPYSPAPGTRAAEELMMSRARKGKERAR